MRTKKDKTNDTIPTKAILLVLNNIEKEAHLFWHDSSVVEWTIEEIKRRTCLDVVEV